MIAAVCFLAASTLVLAGALVVTVRQGAAERRDLIDVIVAKHGPDLRAMRRDTAQAVAGAVAASPEVLAYEADRARDLKAMGYNPDDVPRVPAGFEG